MFKITHENPDVKRIHRVSTKEDKISGTFDFGDLTFDTVEEAKDLIEYHTNERTILMSDQLSVVKT
jgi:hypothetical protein